MASRNELESRLAALEAAFNTEQKRLIESVLRDVIAAAGVSNHWPAGFCELMAEAHQLNDGTTTVENAPLITAWLRHPRAGEYPPLSPITREQIDELPPLDHDAVRSAILRRHEFFKSQGLLTAAGQLVERADVKLMLAPIGEKAA